jgi:hypothetical protein
MADAQTPTRGERNCNPGNIDFDPKIVWQGLLGVEIVPPGENFTPRFCRFDNPEHGIRAIARLLRSYVMHDGCKTIAQIVNRWAPGSENDSAAYVTDVAARCGIDPDKPLACDTGDMADLTRAIIEHENGRIIYDDATIAAAVASALA